MIEIIERINSDWKDALRNKQTLRKDTLSMVRASIQNAEIEKRGELDTNSLVALLNKEIKKRVDAAEAFRRGNREENAATEDAEVEIIKAYLPTQLSDEELEVLVDRAISESEATGIKDMGKAMKTATALVAGRAENRKVSVLIREKLS